MELRKIAESAAETADLLAKFNKIGEQLEIARQLRQRFVEIEALLSDFISTAEEVDEASALLAGFVTARSLLDQQTAAVQAARDATDRELYPHYTKLNRAKHNLCTFCDSDRYLAELKRHRFYLVDERKQRIEINAAMEQTALQAHLKSSCSQWLRWLVVNHRGKVGAHMCDVIMMPCGRIGCHTCGGGTVYSSAENTFTTPLFDAEVSTE